jgi:hypothetical protein
MLPATFDNFFLATSSGGAALIGLLFVATSISPEKVFSRNASPEVTAVATSAFTALVNAFFISISALLPGSGLGYVALLFALMGGINSMSLGFRLAQNRWQHRHDFKGNSLWLRIARDLVLTVGALVVYIFELIFALQLIHNPRDADAVSSLATIILVVNGVGLTRAWELLGARRGGLLGWLNPLAHTDPPTSES